MSGVMSRLNGIALRAAQRSDVVIALFIVMAVVMMIIPLPTTLVDALIGANIAFSLLILIVAFYIASPVDYSSLPPIILLATLFRLALSITTTRLILLEGDAGQMVSAFGNFVIAGEVVIGLVVFLIITVAQFLVITKGAERVAEVAARFMLDAMPGKQMSIDNDMRNGDIDQAEARVRRNRLQQESQLYGAMDGAMKFVKGDAIAGLVILCVNLVGGLLVGMLKRDMSFAEAINTYSLLTVGDGLIAQIPALLIAVGAGTVVTRVNSDQAGDLGSEIVAQLGGHSRALGLTAAILFCAAFLPGFATGVFLLLAAGLGLAAWWVRRRGQSQAEEPGAAAVEGEAAESAAPPAATPAEAPAGAAVEAGVSHRVMLRLAPSLAASIPPETWQDALDATRRRVGHELGIEIPGVGVAERAALGDQRFRLDLDEVSILDGELPAGHVLLDDDALHLELLEIDALRRSPLIERGARHWVAEADVPRLDEAGIGYQRADQVLCGCLEWGLLCHAGEFVGIQETRLLLSRMEEQYAELVGEAVRLVSLQKMAEVLRRLVEGGVPLRALRTILEALVTWGGQEASVVRLTERVRLALSRQICQRYAREDKVLPAWVMTRQVEEPLRAGLRATDDGKPAGLSASLSRELSDWFRQRLEALDVGLAPVVIVSSDIRPALQQWMQRHRLGVSVLAWPEVAADFNLQALAQVRLPASSRDDESSVRVAKE